MKGLQITALQDIKYLSWAFHRRRGELLSRRDATGTEASFRELVRIARAQGARTFELLAALPLARLLQSARRLSETQEVLVRALEGFASTRELSAIAEAQALQFELSRDS